MSVLPRWLGWLAGRGLGLPCSLSAFVHSVFSIALGRVKSPLHARPAVVLPLAPSRPTGNGSPPPVPRPPPFNRCSWELLTWAIPWEGVNAFQLVFMVSSGDRLAMPALEALPGKLPERAVYDAYVALVRRCWAQDPAERPTFGDIISELRNILSTHLAASGSSNVAALAP